MGGDFIALGKPTPTEGFASGVQFIDYLSVSLGDFLGYDDGFALVFVLSGLLLVHSIFKNNIIDNF